MPALCICSQRARNAPNFKQSRQRGGWLFRTFRTSSPTSPRCRVPHLRQPHSQPRPRLPRLQRILAHGIIEPCFKPQTPRIPMPNPTKKPPKEPAPLIEPALAVISGRTYATLDWVLNRAHSDGLCETRVDLVQIPTEENKFTCIMKATVQTKKGTFTAHGDATPRNTGAMIVPHLLRMCESRALGRALRFATNAPTLVEELSEESRRK